MGKRLELVWPNKEKVFLGLAQDGKPIWGTKDDIETRTMIQLDAFGKVNKDNPANLYQQGDNLLIKGDNLLALKSLEHHFAGKIKCIYIDPPFNTGNAFEHYDDGLEHTIWLSMMKARLEILKKLLTEDGAIFVHIDDTEIGYLLALMNEVYGRNNYVALCTIRRSSPTGHKSINPGPMNTSDYVLIYARQKDKWTYTRLFTARSRDKSYSSYIVNFEQGYSYWEIAPLNNVFIKSMGFPSLKEIKQLFSKEEIEIKLNEFVKSNAHAVIELALPNYEGVSEAARKLIDKSKEKIGKIFVLKRDEYSDMYFINGRRILFYKDKLKEIDGEVVAGEPLTTIWNDIPFQALYLEGGISMPKGKKPEKLIQRILEMTTSRSDWVLDSFLGSGTTTAVAHKMGRKWIGIEIGEQVETHCLPRLKRVVSGEDQTGISKSVNWKGGGGFRYCVLGESLFAKDKETGLIMINPRYTNGLLVNAVCNLEDFRLNNHKLWHGVRG
ncbi:MAG: site-specific DNA-methyltransferase, partial [Planctomycetota bacterium]